MFLLFVLLYSQRVARHSCETLQELLHCSSFSLSSLLSIKDKSILTEMTAGCRPQRVILSPFALCNVWCTDSTMTLQKILHKPLHPFAPLKLTLAFSDQGPEYYKTISFPIHKTYKVVVSRWGKSLKMSQRSSIDSLSRSVQFFIRLLEEIFYNI